MTARRAGAASAAAALIGMGAGVVQFGTLAPVWPSTPPTLGGLWLIDVVSVVPIGDPLLRAGLAAACLSAVTAALTARVLARQGHGGVVAAASALAIGFVSYASHISSDRLPASLAALLATSATALALNVDGSRLTRISSAAVLLLAASVLQPAVLAVLPLVVVHAAGGATSARVAAGTAGILIASWWMVGAPEGIGLAGLAVPWLWPFVLVLLSGTVAPLWGGPLAVTALAGTAVAVPLVAAGQPASALAVFPAMLLARGVDGLPALGPRSRDLLAVTLLTISLGEAGRRPAPETWRLLAWRDAVERTLPAGARITTGNRAAAALHGPLFAGRPAALAVVMARHAAPAPGDTSDYLLDDIAASAAHSDPRRVRVPLSFGSASDLVARLPDGTVVGVAVAGAAADRDEMRAVLARIGHQPADGSTVVAAGVIGQRPAPGLLRSDGRLHVLIGEPLTDAGQRSPTDLEMRVMDDGVRVYLRGRNLATGRRWAIIAVRPGGPLIEATADDGEAGAWPLRLPGLDLWH